MSSISTPALKINAVFHFETYAPREFRTAAAKKKNAAPPSSHQCPATGATAAERAALPVTAPHHRHTDTHTNKHMYIYMTASNGQHGSLSAAAATLKYEYVFLGFCQQASMSDAW